MDFFSFTTGSVGFKKFFIIKLKVKTLLPKVRDIAVTLVAINFCHDPDSYRDTMFFAVAKAR
jgi:hypothetical protein